MMGKASVAGLGGGEIEMELSEATVYLAKATNTKVADIDSSAIYAVNAWGQSEYYYFGTAFIQNGAIVKQTGNLLVYTLTGGELFAKPNSAQSYLINVAKIGG